MKFSVSPSAGIDWPTCVGALQERIGDSVFLSTVALQAHPSSAAAPIIAGVLFIDAGRIMKKCTMGIAAVVVLLGTPALAAPPANPAWNWTGWYVGGNLGYSWGKDNGPVTFSDPVTGPLLSLNSNTRLDGVIGGLQIGHNWQIQNWVYGLEADIQASGQRGSSTIVCPGGTATALNGTCSPGHVGDTAPFNVPAIPATDSLSEKLDWFGTFRGRIGPTVTPKTFAYLTGGLAYGHIGVTNAVSGVSLVGPQGVNGVTLVPGGGGLSTSTIKLGWTIGCGIESVISGNWTAKIEYLYVDLGTVSGSFATTLLTPAGNNLIVSYSSHVTDNILRAGLNYQFH